MINIKTYFLRIIIALIVIMGIIILLTCNSNILLPRFNRITTTSNGISVKMLTPAQVITFYVDSLKSGDYKAINSIVSNTFLKEYNDGKYYSKIPFIC